MSFKRMLILLVAVLMLTCSSLALNAGNYEEENDDAGVIPAVLVLRPDRPLVGSAIPKALEEIASEEAKEKALEEKMKKREELRKEAEEQAKKEQEEKPEEKIEVENEETKKEEFKWDGEVLNARNGIVYGPSGKESYYNLNMNGVIEEMRRLGFCEEEYPYYIREDGVKMLGDYVMCAANLSKRPKGTKVQTTLGMAIVCDTGNFAKRDPMQVDIAVDW